VLPTGAGKSAIYQLAALIIPGPTVVVSPLIALQRDQVAALLANGVDAAEANSRSGRPSAGRPSLGVAVTALFGAYWALSRSRTRP
jgi:superfamily II DNA helicase RecQ